MTNDEIVLAAATRAGLKWCVTEISWFGTGGTAWLHKRFAAGTEMEQLQIIFDNQLMFGSVAVMS